MRFHDNFHWDSAPVGDVLMSCDPDVQLDHWGYPRGGGYWWRQHPRRAVEEHLKMLNGTDAVHDFQGDSLVWIEEVNTDFSSIHVIAIVAGPYFPSVPPQAFAPEVRCSRHRNGDGSLCLAHPSEYSNLTTILEIRNLACAWLFAYEAYEETGEWPAAEAD